MRRAIRLSERTERPGTQLASCRATGTPAKRAASPSPSERKPPKRRTNSGFSRRSSLRANRKLENKLLANFSRCIRPPAKARPGAVKKCSCPYFSTSRESTCFSLIRSRHSCSRSSSTSATAIPGERCPPVPPQAIKTLLISRAASEALAFPTGGSRLE